MSEKLVIRRSPIHRLLLVLAGLALVLAALDVVVFYKLSTAPATDSAGSLTPQGRTERRTDLIWGTLLMASGGVLLLAGFGGLIGGKPVVELGEEGLRLRVAGPTAAITIPWDQIRSIRTGADYGDDGRIPTPVMLVEVEDRNGYPGALWGAEWDGDVLAMDADGWETPVEEVVIRIKLVLERIDNNREA